MKDKVFPPSLPENTSEGLPLRRGAQRLSRFQNRRSSPERGHDLWLLTLSDLLLLLMIFFVVLFGMTLQKEEHSVQSLPKEVVVSVEPEENLLKTEPTHPPDVLPKELPASLEMDLNMILGTAEGSEEVTVTRDPNHLVLTFSDRIVFDPGQVELKPSAQSILDKVASFVMAHPYLLVEVQGHTDDRPINNKRYPSNWELSVDRATQVAKALIRLGLPPSQLAVKGFGEYQALFPNDSDSNRLKNRRVEIQFSLPPQS